MQTQVMIALFGLFAEVERDLISERTKEGLATARAKGRWERPSLSRGRGEARIHGS
jgi:DNA invertase Pin-like site-specific DNA recombinase